jgi:hypothetical protein
MDDDKPFDYMQSDALAHLESAKEGLLEASKIASTRLREIWNPETRKYEPYAEMVALHDIINKNLKVYNGISAAQRALKKEVK